MCMFDDEEEDTEIVNAGTDTYTLMMYVCGSDLESDGGYASDDIEEMLTEEEHAVYKRARNAKSYTMPKNASATEYRTATGFEALCGWLYLSGSNERLLELLKKAFSDYKE